MNADHRRALTRALATVLKDRLHTNGTHLTLPPAQITIPAPIVEVVNQVATPSVHVLNEQVNPTPQVTVQVDMGPVAAVLQQVQSTLEEFVQAINEDRALLSQLLQLLAEQQPPTFAPVVQVPEPNVTVEAPDIKFPERLNRKFRITHDDGSVSTVTEV